MSNCYNQPCQWSTDNRTLRGAWTIAFNPSWVSEVMWRFQLFSPCCSHTLEVTTEVTLGWEQHEGKDEQHLPWLDSVIWHGSMAGKRVPQLLLCSGFLWMKGPLVDSLLCGFLPKSCLVSPLVSGYLLDVCALLSLAAVLLELSSIHIHMHINIYIYADSGTYSDTLWEKHPL